MPDPDYIRQLTEVLRSTGEFLAVAFVVFGVAATGLIGLWVKSRTALNKAHADLAASQKDLAEAQKQGARELPAQLTAGMDSMASKLVDTLSPIIKNQDTTITTLNTRVDTLAADLSQRDQRITALEQQSQRDRTQIDDLCKAVAARERTNEDLTKRLDALQQSLNEKITELEKAKQTIAEQAAQLAQLDDLKKRVETLERQVEMLSTERDDLIRQRDEALAQNARLNAALAEKTEALAKAEAELATLRGKQDALAMRVENQGKTIADLSKPIPSEAPMTPEAKD